MTVYEHDDQGLRVIGYNQGIFFYDPDRNLRCELYLRPDGTLYSSCGGIASGGTPVATPGITAVLEGPGINILAPVTATPKVGLGGDTILLYDSGGAPVAEFAFTSAGLTLALAAMADGDVCETPAGTISGGPWTVGAGTLRGISRTGSVLDGQVTLADGTALENLSIVRSEDDAGDINGVVDGGGTATLKNVTVSVSNATGAAAAVYMAVGGTITAYDCELLAPVGADGFAATITDGTLYQYGGRAVGTIPLMPYNL